MQDGHAAGCLTDACGQVGIIDRVSDVAVVQIVLELIHCHNGTVLFRFLRGGPQVGQDHGVFHSDGNGVGKIGDVGSDLAGLQSLGHGLFVHKSVSGKIEEMNAVLHLCDAFPVNHLFRGFHVGHMNGDKVAVLIDLVDGLGVADAPDQLPGSVDGQIGIVAVDIHAQLLGGVGHVDADGAKADDAQSLALDLVARESLLGLFRSLAYVGIGDIGPDPFCAAHDVTGRQDQTGDDQLLDGVGVGAGCIEYDNAFLSAALQGDIVDAGAGTGDGSEAGGEGHFLHIGGTDQYACRVVHGIHQAVALAETGGPHCADVVKAVNLSLFHSFNSPWSLLL